MVYLPGLDRSVLELGTWYWNNRFRTNSIIGEKIYGHEI